MKKLLLIASALLAFSFFGCEQPSNSTTPDTGKSDVVVDSGDDTTGDEETPTPEPIVVVDEEGKTLSFTCVINPWGSNGSVQIELPQSIMLNEGDVYTVSGEVEFCTPSKGILNQFYMQDTIAYGAPLSYNMIYSDTTLADTTKSFSGDWTVEANQAGELKKLQFCLGWVQDNDSEADATCDVVIKNVKFLKK